MKVRMLSFVERNINILIIIFVFGCVVDAIYYHLYLTYLVDDFYINVALSIGLFFISIYISAWRSHVERLYDSRVTLYKDLLKLKSVIDVSVGQLNEKGHFEAIITRQSFLMKLEEKEYVFVDNENIIFTDRFTKLESLCLDLLRESRSGQITKAKSIVLWSLKKYIWLSYHFFQHQTKVNIDYLKRTYTDRLFSMSFFIDDTYKNFGIIKELIKDTKNSIYGIDSKLDYIDRLENQHSEIKKNIEIGFEDIRDVLADIEMDIESR